jgi:VanZ family protein
LLHIPLYGVLTLLLLLALCTGRGRYIYPRLITGAFIAAGVGALDEFYQTLIPAREGSWGDIFLDALGIGIALMIFPRLLTVLGKKFRIG